MTAAKPAITKNAKSASASKDFSESSDRYTDEDFESMSKSASHFSGLPKPGAKKLESSGTYTDQNRIISTYTKKDNRFA